MHKAYQLKIYFANRFTFLNSIKLCAVRKMVKYTFKSFKMNDLLNH